MWIRAREDTLYRLKCGEGKAKVWANLCHIWRFSLPVYTCVFCIRVIAGRRCAPEWPMILMTKQNETFSSHKNLNLRSTYLLFSPASLSVFFSGWVFAQLYINTTNCWFPYLAHMMTSELSSWHLSKIHLLKKTMRWRWKLWKKLVNGHWVRIFKLVNNSLNLNGTPEIYALL